MSFLKRVEEMRLEDGFSGHYHNGYLIAKGEATTIVAEADARIQELEAELVRIRGCDKPPSEGGKPRHFPESLEELDRKVAVIDPEFFQNVAEEIRYQMGLVNILADQIARYMGETVPRVKRAAEEVYRMPQDPNSHEEPTLEDFTPDMLPGFWAGGRTPQDVQEEDKDVRSEHNEE